MKKKTFTNEYEYSQEISSAIISLCSQEEKNAVIKDSAYMANRFRFDMLLTKGCHALGIKGPAILEYKVHLGPSITRYIEMVKKELSDNFSIYIIYQNSQIPVDYIKMLTSESVYFISADSIFRKAKKYKLLPLEEMEQYPRLRGKITLFIGAGVSMDAGLPSWSDLLEGLVDYIEDKNTKELVKSIEDKNLIIKAQKIMVAIKEGLKATGPHEVIKRALYSNNEQNEESDLVNEIANLLNDGVIDAIVTYNYDDIIERKLESCGIPYSLITDGNKLMERTGIPILHVHGYIPKSEELKNIPQLVLDDSSYNRLFSDAYTWTNVAQLHYLRSSNCVFLGFSMQDPNLRRLLEIAHIGNSEGDKHCIFLQREEHGKSDAEKHITNKIMSELGLRIIWFDEYCDLPQKLKFLFDNTSN